MQISSTTRAAWAALGAVALGAGVAAHPACAGVEYSIRDLGTLGGDESYAYAINDHGEVVGWSYDEGYESRAFHTDSAGTMKPLDLGVGMRGEAYGINNSGVVVGYASQSDESPMRGFQINAAGVTTFLGTLGGRTSWATGINASGQIVGLADYEDQSIMSHGFRTGGGGTGMIELPLLPGGLTSSAEAINDAGEAVGYSGFNGDFITHAFRTSVAGVTTDMGTLGGKVSWASAINNNGQVAGAASTVPGKEYPHHAFRADADGVMTDLGTLDNDVRNFSYGNGINEIGQVVGYAYTAEGQDHAFIYGDDAGMRDLNDLIPSGIGWLLIEAYDINNTGQIVGYGAHYLGNGHSEIRAFALTPVPEPSGLLLLGLAVPALLRRRRRAFAARAAAAVLCASAAQAPAQNYTPIFGGPTYTPGVAGYVVPITNSRPLAGDGVAVCVFENIDAAGARRGQSVVRWDISGAPPVAYNNLWTDRAGEARMDVVAVNSSGTAVGHEDKYDSSGAQVGMAGVRWDASGTTTTELGPFAPHAINSAGAIVGTSRRYTSTGQDLGPRAVRWDADSAAVYELMIPGADHTAYMESWALDINDAGMILGGGTVPSRTGLRWDPSGAVVQLPSPFTAFPDGGVAAMNATGIAVGFESKYPNQIFSKNRAVRWDASGNPTELMGPATTIGGWGFSDAVAINDAGTALGVAEKLVSGSRGTRAVRWDASGTGTELGHLGLDSNNSTGVTAVGITDSGIAVGVVDIHGSGYFSGTAAVMWGPDDAAVPLISLLDPAIGWLELMAVTDVTANGWVTGYGDFDPDGLGGQDSYTRAFLMQIPEPGSIVSLVLGGMLALRRRRQN